MRRLDECKHVPYCRLAIKLNNVFVFNFCIKSWPRGLGIGTGALSGPKTPFSEKNRLSRTIYVLGFWRQRKRREILKMQFTFKDFVSSSFLIKLFPFHSFRSILAD